MSMSAALASPCATRGRGAQDVRAGGSFSVKKHGRQGVPLGRKLRLRGALQRPVRMHARKRFTRLVVPARQGAGAPEPFTRVLANYCF